MLDTNTLCFAANRTLSAATAESSQRYRTRREGGGKNIVQTVRLNFKQSKLWILLCADELQRKINLFKKMTTINRLCHNVFWHI